MQVLLEYVSTADDLAGGRQFIVDGTLLPCWSWAAHPDLYLGKHKTTVVTTPVKEYACGEGPRFNSASVGSAQYGRDRIASPRLRRAVRSSSPSPILAYPGSHFLRGLSLASPVRRAGSPVRRSVRTFCAVSRRPAGPLAPPPRRARLRSR